MPGLSRRRHVRCDRRRRPCRDCRRPVEPPCPAREHDEQRDDASGERRQRGALLWRGRSCWRRWLRLRRDADLQRVNPDRVGDVLELGLAEVGDRQIKPSLHLPVGVLGQADRARLAHAFQPRGDIDAVAHQVAVALLDHVAQMNADTELDAALRGLSRRCARPSRSALRSRSARRRRRCGTRRALPSPVRLTMRPRCASMAGSIRSLRSPRSRDSVRSSSVPGEPAVADDIRDQNRRDFPGSRHRAPLRRDGD